MITDFKDTTYHSSIFRISIFIIVITSLVSASLIYLNDTDLFNSVILTTVVLLITIIVVRLHYVKVSVCNIDVTYCLGFLTFKYSYFGNKLNPIASTDRFFNKLLLRKPILQVERMVDPILIIHYLPCFFFNRVTFRTMIKHISICSSIYVDAQDTQDLEYFVQMKDKFISNLERIEEVKRRIVMQEQLIKEELDKEVNIDMNDETNDSNEV